MRSAVWLTSLQGFTTALAFLARGTFTFAQMNWILIKVFFGSSYLGFVSQRASLCRQFMADFSDRMWLKR
jgi:hypothetical protein